MKLCTISPGDDCTEQPTKTVKFPWNDKPLPACEAHVAHAQQLMTNLSRQSELVIGELELDGDPGPETPRDLPSPSPSLPNVATITARGREHLALELELEQKRLERVRLELELADKVKLVADSSLAGLAGLWETITGQLPELVQQFKAAATQEETSSSTVDGEATPPEASDPSGAPEAAPPVQASEPDPRAT